MAAVQLPIDDVNPFIFSSGAWDQHDKFEWAFNNTRSLTRRAGAYKVVRFVGTSITVYGGLQPIAGTINDTSLIVAQFSIDDGTPTVYAPQEDTTQYIRVTYYQSHKLPMGEHVLMIMNMAEDDLIWLDYFVIEGAAGGPDPELLHSDGARVPSAPLQIPTKSTGSGANTLTALPRWSTVIINNASVDVAATGTPINSSTITPTQIAASVLDITSSTLPSSMSDISNPSAPITTYQSTIINAYNSQTPSSKQQKNTLPIVLGTCGALLAILLILALVNLQRRRKRQNIRLKEDPLQPYIADFTARHFHGTLPEKVPMPNRATSPRVDSRQSGRIPHRISAREPHSALPSYEA